MNMNEYKFVGLVFSLQSHIQYVEGFPFLCHSKVIKFIEKQSECDFYAKNKVKDIKFQHQRNKRQKDSHSIAVIIVFTIPIFGLFQKQKYKQFTIFSH